MEGHYIMIKGSIQEKDTMISMYPTSNIGVPQYMRQMLTSIKGKINGNTIIVGNFKYLLFDCIRFLLHHAESFLCSSWNLATEHRLTGYGAWA